MDPIDYQIVAFDHVQLAMPAGEESQAERFYCGLLGFTRVPKPAPLAARGGCWFQRGEVWLHLGVESDFRAARKAHPAFRVLGFDALLARLRGANIELRPSSEIPGVRRCHVDDPFGNRIELIDAQPG